MRLRNPFPTSTRTTIVAALAVTSVTAGVALVATGLLRAPESAQAQPAAAAAPVAVAQPAGTLGARPKAYTSGVRLAAYDRTAGTALLVAAGSGTPTGAVQPGDVIASAPTASAPDGALFKVGTVTATRRGIAVRTQPATLKDALGATSVSRTIDARSLTATVTPLNPGVRPAPTGSPSAAPARSAGPPRSPAASLPAGRYRDRY